MAQRQVVRDDAFLRDAMRAHGASVLRLALAQTGSRADAEDVYQDVFVSLACSTTDFADDAEHLRAWLLRVTINRTRDLARSWWRRHTQSFEALEFEMSAGGDSPTEDAGEAPFRSAALWRAVQRLPERYRTVVHLHYVEGLPAAKIAELCDISESTVRTRLSRAHQKLKASLEGEL